MDISAFAQFDTPIGRCAIAWRGDLIVATSLPGRLGSRFASMVEALPPPFVEAAIGGIRSLLSGEQADLSSVPLDLDQVSVFERHVYAATRAIGVGETRTYGEIARSVGSVSDARAVGRALGRNPWPIVIPCHRVLSSGGKSGGFSAPGGASTKMRMLEIECARRDSHASLFDNLPWSLKAN